MSTLWTILLICLSILSGLSDSYYYDHDRKVFWTKNQTAISEHNEDFIGNETNFRSSKYEGKISNVKISMISIKERYDVNFHPVG